ncbi:hypothetical protein N7492_007446 [Penicillium capsulatum]|uniref:L-dopachrome isomerase n=1 Tax=Penicillium capsulatum TaxID=69766 RepID=A0A9W9I1A9_9EURO|nr:hypothetical protein N7492_007446 [Penicillium capsulatum]
MDPRRPHLPRLATNLAPHDRQLTAKPSKENIPIRRVDTPVPPQEDGETIPPLAGFLYEAPTKPLVAKVESPVAKVKQLLYEDAFAVRSSHNSPQERVARNSVVVAELKTNVQSKVEGFKLAGDLAFRLAQVYQRPESNIMVSLQQDVCLFFDASLPSYLLKIHALPSLIAPMTNVRNTDLIQGALYELIRIPADHGIVLYFPIPEDNLGINGTTARGKSRAWNAPNRLRAPEFSRLSLAP